MSEVRQFVLTPRLLDGRLPFVIGDIHGCYDELCELLTLAENEHSNFLPIFVGDLVNKGPKSLEVLRKLRNSKAYSVVGNHDESVIRRYLDFKDKQINPTKRKYEWLINMNEDDFAYLRSLPHIIQIPSHQIIIVHAGLKPGVDIDKQNPHDLTHMRNIVVDPTGDVLNPKELLDKGQPWATYWKGPEHVYFGHDAYRRFQQFPFATGLDTGCVYGGKLTGCFPTQGGKMLSVDAKQTYEQPDSTKLKPCEV